MSRLNRYNNPSGYYHIMQRGVGKQVLFETPDDYEKYFKNIFHYREKNDIKLLAYCLMENHVHLLIFSDDIDEVKSFMHRLGTSYAQYYNEKYTHVGHVFQGRYRSEYISDRAHLINCIRYIHHNPQKAGYCGQSEYRWSSFSEYANGSFLCDTDYVFMNIVEKEHLMQLHCIDVDESFMDEKPIVTTREAIEFLREKYGVESGTEIKALDRRKRDEAILYLRDAGFSYKRIERITGVSRGIIQKSKKVRTA